MVFSDQFYGFCLVGQRTILHATSDREGHRLLSYVQFRRCFFGLMRPTHVTDGNKNHIALIGLES